MATIISHWLKVHSRLLKNYIFVKKCFVISFWMFRTSNIAHYSFTLYYCATFNSLDATIRMSNSLDPDQAQHFVGPDLGPNFLQRLSADDKVTASGQRVR